MDEVLTRIDGNVGVMKINRPDRMNAFTPSVLESLLDALQTFEEGDKVRAVLFTGAGDRAFCAGVDLDEGAIDSTIDSLDTVHRAQRLLKGIRRSDLPVVAGVMGHAMGAGMDLALGCDIRVLREDVKLSQSYTSVGLVPGDGGAYLLPRLLGEEKAKDLIFSGREITGAEAYDLGLGTKLVEGDAEATRERARELARQYASGPTVALGTAKRLVNESHDVNLDTALSHAIEGIAECSKTADHRTAVEAFREGRDPEFVGE